MKLTVNEKYALIEMKTRYMKALITRSENPADFDTNINCLKEMVEVGHRFQELMQPHLEKSMKATEKAANSHCNPFALLKATLKLKAETGVLKEASAIIFDSEMMGSIKSEFSKEPRIISLNYNEHGNRENSL